MEIEKENADYIESFIELFIELIEQRIKFNDLILFLKNEASQVYMDKERILGFIKQLENKEVKEDE